MIFRNSSLSQIKGGGQLTRIKGGEGEVKLPIRSPPSWLQSIHMMRWAENDW